MSIKSQKASQIGQFWQNSQYNKIISNKTLLWTIELNFEQLSNKKKTEIKIITNLKKRFFNGYDTIHTVNCVREWIYRIDLIPVSLNVCVCKCGKFIKLL